jgi:hypothetical protein
MDEASGTHEQAFRTDFCGHLSCGTGELKHNLPRKATKMKQIGSKKITECATFTESRLGGLDPSKT